MENETLQGTVKFFNSEKGFGFIKTDNTNEEIFVHATGLVDEIKENDRVSFETTQGRKGMNAVNVTVLR
ncbi:MAG TPA: cold shock domain-containing protein [Edaphocola sp.]|nr:cold shock domain-containing protein [Edaphocola sp.]